MTGVIRSSNIDQMDKAIQALAIKAVITPLEFNNKIIEAYGIKTKEQLKVWKKAEKTIAEGYAFLASIKEDLREVSTR